MKFVLATDSFKGSLSNEKINKILTEVISTEIPGSEIVPLLVADGGDGTLNALIKQTNGKFIECYVNNPLFKKIKSKYGIFNNTAVISMCECSGLSLIEENKRNPMNTTSYGTGELIKHAVTNGVKRIIITLGGSATNDGGIGILSALGCKIIKVNGELCKGCGSELIDIAKIDFSNALDLSGINITVLSDVTNPITGKDGATYTFGRQKGATDKQLDMLEKGMLNWQSILENYSGKSLQTLSGGGAAGGIGAALYSFFNAEIKSGIEAILEIVNFDNTIKDADYIITGEGKLDSQTEKGKVISGIITHAKKHNIPVIAIAGTLNNDIDNLYSKGLTAAFSIINEPAELNRIIDNSELLYAKTAKNIIRLIKS